MWSLSLNDIVAAKEELTGRRAAIKARYEKDLQAVDDDLRNIATLELAASIFVKTHKKEATGQEVIADLVPVEELNETPALVSQAPTDTGEQVGFSELDPTPSSPDAYAMDSLTDRKGSRWRIR